MSIYIRENFVNVAQILKYRINRVNHIKDSCFNPFGFLLFLHMLDFMFKISIPIHMQ